jgi:hypothetical protein
MVILRSLENSCELMGKYGEYDHFVGPAYIRLSKSEPELEHGGHVKQRSRVKAKLTPLASSLMQSSIRLISGMSSGLILLGH